MWEMNGRQIIGGSGDFQNLGANSGWRVATTGDFNGDGKADILLQNASGAVAMWAMSGSQCRSGADLFQNLGYQFWLERRGESCRTSTATASRTSCSQNANGGVAMWQMNGTKVTSAAASSKTLGANSGWSVAGVGDYNGDGFGHPAAQRQWRDVDLGHDRRRM